MPFFNLGISNYIINYEIVATSNKNNYRHVEKLSKSYRSINQKKAIENFENDMKESINLGKKNNPNVEVKYKIINIIEEA